MINTRHYTLQLAKAEAKYAKLVAKNAKSAKKVDQKKLDWWKKQYVTHA